MKTRILLLTLIITLLASCSRSDKFTVEGTITDGRTMNIRIVYPGEDNINNILTASRDGKFGFEGTAPAGGAILEVLDNNYRTLGRAYVANGDEIKMAVDASNPEKSRAAGNSVNEGWAKWMDANAKVLAARDIAGINRAVAVYVKAHPDDILSTVLMVTTYDSSVNPVESAKLLASIEAGARPASLIDPYSTLSALAEDGKGVDKVHVGAIPYLTEKDTVATFQPKTHRRSLLVFSTAALSRDSIADTLRRLKANPVRRAQVLEFRMDADTAAWHRAIRNDSVTWPVAWVPGSVASSGVDRLMVPGLPYFIVADSLGRQLYRGASISAAMKKLRN